MAKKVAQKRTTDGSRTTQQMRSPEENRTQSTQTGSSAKMGQATQSLKTPDNEREFPLLKGSYKLLIIGIAIIIFGFLLMMGGGSDNPENFNYAIFSFRRITLAPIVVLIGFAFIFWVIIRRDKSASDTPQ